MRKWTFGLYKMRGISWVAEDLLLSQEGLWSMELVVTILLIYYYCSSSGGSGGGSSSSSSSRRCCSVKSSKSSHTTRNNTRPLPSRFQDRNFIRISSTGTSYVLSWNHVSTAGWTVTRYLVFHSTCSTISWRQPRFFSFKYFPQHSLLY
jgi:hypothetical protein